MTFGAAANAGENIATISQVGAVATRAEQVQTGTSNEASILQDFGADSKASVVQDGDSNRATVNQSANNAALRVATFRGLPEKAPHPTKLIHFNTLNTFNAS